MSSACELVHLSIESSGGSVAYGAPGSPMEEDPRKDWVMPPHLLLGHLCPFSPPPPPPALNQGIGGSRGQCSWFPVREPEVLPKQAIKKPSASERIGELGFITPAVPELLILQILSPSLWTLQGLYSLIHGCYKGNLKSHKNFYIKQL